ncbi:Spore coat polysaccharide biosynthesis protein SpsF [Planctomycetales bacterium 10988]|nr:Spore coat polysaccharide biosynthesis protein SpsF [Planctomycetales bacterium 10988]
MSKKLTVRVIVQARMGSSRLPGKIFANLQNHPVLDWVTSRLQRGLFVLKQSASINPELWVATTVHPRDDRTSRWCYEHGLRCFRGSEKDVLDRYVQASEGLDDEDVVVRATADNPFYCPLRVADLIQTHLQKQPDYTFIRGLSYVVPEVMQVKTLRTLREVALDAESREHVTPFLRTPGLHSFPNQFKTQAMPSSWNHLRPEVRLTIDTAHDYILLSKILSSISKQNNPHHFKTVSLETLYQAWDEMQAIRLQAAMRPLVPKHAA